ncbi:MAG: hypothetical protein RBR71_14430, partial [Gudongella sp.]|nr:hypothetical protein [Gudongella sp.]
MWEIIKYMFYCLALFISATFGNNPEGLTWVNGLIGFGTLLLVILLAALLFYCILLINYFFFMDRPTSVKVDKAVTEKRSIGVLFIVVTMITVILISFDQTRLYGFILFGFIFVISGLFVILLRILFDSSDKAIVSGTLVQLEHIVDGEGYSSYRPHYQYEYQNCKYILISQFTAFWYKKTKRIGDVISIVINAKNPKNARLNKPIYT